MKVILLERLSHLGNLGDTVEIKPGFGRNYLIPQGKAVMATAANIKDFEAKKSELEAKAKKILEEAKTRASQLKGLSLELKEQASEEGKLFGSVGSAEIVAAAEKAGKTINKSEVQFPEGVIKNIGDFTVEIHLHHGEVVVPVAVKVISA